MDEKCCGSAKHDESCGTGKHEASNKHKDHVSGCESVKEEHKHDSCCG